MRCYQCGETYIAKEESLEWTDEYIGPFTVEGAEYFECDTCGDYLFPPKTAELIETARGLALEKILQSLPISAFVTAAEAARMLGISRQEFINIAGFEGVLFFRLNLTKKQFI